MKKLIFIFFGLNITTAVLSQTITNSTISIAGGQLKNGNLLLNYTVGETFVGIQSNGNMKLVNGFWTVVPSTYVPSANIVYRFTGTGNFSDAGNWQNGKTPPNPLPNGSEIIIDHIIGGQCVLDLSYKVNSNGKFSVISNKYLIVKGNLEIHKP